LEHIPHQHQGVSPYQTKKNTQKRVKIIIGLIFSIGLIIIVLTMDFLPKKLGEKDLIHIKGVVYEPFCVIKPHRGKSYLYGNISGVKGCFFDFSLIERYSDRSRALIKNAKVSDTIIVAIPKTDFYNATRPGPKSIIDVHFKSHTFTVYEIYHKNKCYQTLEQSNQAIGENSRIGIIILIILITVLIIRDVWQKE
jgi:hypothetical protein